MTYRMYGALIASLGAVALMLVPNETFANSGRAPGGGFRSAHAMARPSGIHSFRHHRGFGAGAFWPGAFWPGDFSEPSNGEPAGGYAQPITGDIHYSSTCVYDMPWDWAHRCPPMVAPSDRAYAPSCPAETVTVRGRDGEEQTVNITRCY